MEDIVNTAVLTLVQVADRAEESARWTKILPATSPRSPRATALHRRLWEMPRIVG
ncbi:MAG: hypothetical protein MZV64_28585 [Ignavibacteriales bacterium]|nr:hypothetical protein [Ignavibacteriales bacterium]